MSQTARRGQTPSGAVTRGEARRTKEGVHQGWTAGDEQRPQQMARLMRMTGRTATLRAGARAAPRKKMIMRHQQIWHRRPGEPEWLVY